MLPFWKKKPRKQLLESARALASMARKVVNYRKDVLSEQAILELREVEGTLRTMVRGDAPDADLEEARDRADNLLHKHGGDFYPVHFWNENIEVVIVAAIVAIAVRTYFIQPFKIPTNSMWPTYAGMTATAYDVTEGETRPSAPVRLFNFVTEFAKNHRLRAPVAGEVTVAIQVEKTRDGETVNARVPFEAIPHRSFFVFPGQKWVYSLGIRQAGGSFETVQVQTPGDFQLGDVILDTYFPEARSLTEVHENALAQGLGTSRFLGPTPSGNPVFEHLIPTGYTVEEGDLVLDFDIQTGDMLFVDRFSYHFVRPEIGDPIVFRTDRIPGERTPAGEAREQYYIKRLVGKPGDTLEIRPPVLYRNGEPIEGAAAFEANHEQIGEYEGYQAAGFLSPGQTQTLGEDYYFAMGDNSDASRDSRFWGYRREKRTTEEIVANVPPNHVPENDIVGQALFIFYPLTGRWGPAE
ncbi:MAG: signal peptidase I [Opitutales bacterium]